MVEDIKVETWFDPVDMELPRPEEMPVLLEMIQNGVACKWSYKDTWFVWHECNETECGIPYAAGDMEDLKMMLHAFTVEMMEKGYERCWIRGRPGWERALKDLYDMKVHSVCYEITRKDVH